MYKIKTLNQISSIGLDKFSRDLYEVGTEISDPDAILVRSQKLSMDDVAPSLRAVGRAGAGVNNIPVSDYTEKGIVVFNTPGANANAVKELVNAALLMSVRGIVQGIGFVEDLDSNLDQDALNKLVETEKKRFKGNEIAGKTLGVLGLGAIGSKVAEMGLQLGMQVVGFDPALSVDAAWRLSSRIQPMTNMQALFSRSDIVSLHVPALDSTRGLVNKESLVYFKPDGILLNYSRKEIVNAADIRDALVNEKLGGYFTDFPSVELLGVKGAHATPHLGASTDEAEENCAAMVAEQVIDFLQHGNIRNSVNFPEVHLDPTDGHRLVLANKNVPRILGQVLSILADHDINVIDMLNKSRDDVAYNLIDVETPLSDDILAQISAIEDVINVKVL